MINNELCHPEKQKECIRNIFNMTSLLEQSDKNTAMIQNMYLQQRIGLVNICKKIFIDQFGFKIGIVDIEFDAINNCIDEEITKNINKKITENLNPIMQQDTTTKIYFIFIHFNLHINIAYINTNKQEYSYYEPQQPNSAHIRLDSQHYCIQLLFDAFFSDNTYTKIELPKNILQQRHLPLCVMYILHLFLYLYIQYASTYKIHFPYESYTDGFNASEIYIIYFIKYILKLCHEYKLIPDIEYYILTNNMYQINQIFAKQSVTIKTDIFTKLFQLTNKQYMIDYLLNDSVITDTQIIKLFNDGLTTIAVYIVQSIGFTVFINNMYTFLFSLIRKISNINIQNTNKQTVLMIIASAFAEINIQSKELSENAIIIHNNTATMFNELLANGKIDINIRDEQGRTALMIFASAINMQPKLFYQSSSSTLYIDKLRMFDQLLALSDVNIQDNNGCNVVYYIHKNNDALKKLLTQYPNIDVEQLDIHDRVKVSLLSSLLYDYDENDRKIALILLTSKQINVNSRDWDNNTPLMRAVYHGDYLFVEALLQHLKLDVNAQDSYGNSALIHAKELGNEHIYELLVKHPPVAQHGGSLKTQNILTNINNKRDTEFYKHKYYKYRDKLNN